MSGCQVAAPTLETYFSGGNLFVCVFMNVMSVKDLLDFNCSLVKKLRYTDIVPFDSTHVCNMH